MRLLLYLVVFIGFSSASAGSYEDYFEAIRRDNPEVVLSLLQRGFDPDTPSKDGLSGLYLALREPSPRVAGVLIDWPRTRFDARTPQDETPLMMACLKGQLDLAKRLVSRGADVNKTGWAPLHYAATGGHVAVMQFLLDEHAYIDAESPNGTTPLMMAARYGSTGAVQLLLDEGADPSLKNQLGLTAVDFARLGSRPDAVKLIQQALAGRR